MKIVKRIIFIVFLVLVLTAAGFIGNFVRLLVLEKKDDIHLKMSDVHTAGKTDRYIPQGLTYSNKHKVMLQTSYNKDKKVSKLYVTNIVTGKLEKELRIINTDDSENKSHIGGITTDDNKVWITSDYKINEFSLDEIMKTQEDYIKSVKEDELPVRGDFCTYTENNLWVGDFFLNPFYKVPNNTPLLMQYSTVVEQVPAPAEGEENSEEAPAAPAEVKGIDFKKPVAVFSLPKKVQGMVIFENKEENKIDFYVDGSFTLVQSTFTHYKVDLNNKDEIELDGAKYPYYKYENSEVISTEKMPPMAEGMVYCNVTGKREIYIVFESCSDAYKIAVPKMDRIMKYNLDRKESK